MNDKSIFGLKENGPDYDDQQHQTCFHFETPSDSSFADDDANRFYLNLEGEHVSYISGTDVLIGASETIESDISPDLHLDSTNIILNTDTENLHDHDAALIILSTSSVDHTIDLIADTSHEILTNPLDSANTVLDTSIDNSFVDVLSEQSGGYLNIPLALESNQSSAPKKKDKKEKKEKKTKKVIKEKKEKKEGKKTKSKRGRKPHFGKNSKPTCSICSVEFTNTASLKTHMLIHSGERPFRCDLCEKSFTRSTVLRIHRRLHTGEKPYKCKLCESGYVTKEALARHVVKDHPTDNDADLQKEKPSHICEICKKGLCSKYSLQSHMNIHRFQQNGEEEAGVECKFCKKKFTCRYTLQRHVFEKHNRRGIISCHVCKESFSSKWEHSRHQDLHASNNKYQCDVCSKTFGKKFQLLYHLQVHEAAKKSSFSCYLCKKLYTSRESFLEHILGYVQSEMQIFSCSQCPISFSDPRQLKLHLNETHKLPVISDLNYCDICKVSSTDANKYYEHLFEKHDSVDILCNECGCFFKSRRQYDEHFMAHVL